MNKHDEQVKTVPPQPAKLTLPDALAGVAVRWALNNATEGSALHDGWLSPQASPGETK